MAVREKAQGAPITSAWRNDRHDAFELTLQRIHESLFAHFATLVVKIATQAPNAQAERRYKGSEVL